MAAVRSSDEAAAMVPGALREGAVPRKGSRRQGTMPRYARCANVSLARRVREASADRTGRRGEKHRRLAGVLDRSKATCLRRR